MYAPDWQQATKYELHQVYRQAGDLEYLEFLNSIRHTVPSAEYLLSILEHCYKPVDALASLLDPTVTILCTHRADVIKHNQTTLQWLFQHNHVGGIREVGLVTNAALEPDLYR